MTATTPLHIQFASSLHDFAGFTDTTLIKAQYCLLDYLSCVYATQDFPWVRQIQNAAIVNSATTAGSPIIGTAHRVCAQDAAMANAVAGHSLVRDDMHLGSVSHLGVVVIPVALALTNGSSLSGRQFLEALVCGYEAGGKLGALLMNVESAKKFRPTGLIGAFAAAATAARLTGYDTTQTANALGFASNYITGLNEWAAWGSDDMYFHPGIAARNGMMALLLAREGARAADGALDGTAGLFSAMGKKVPDNPPLPFSDEPEINRVFFKQVPACNYAQTAAQVAINIRQAGFKPGNDDTAIVVSVPHAAAHYPGCDYPGPFTSILQARMSIHFNVASALLHGDFEDSHYRDFGNQDITNLARCIRVTIDDELTAAYPARQGAAIRATTAQDTYSDNLHDVLRASEAEIEARFLAAASECIGKQAATRLLEYVLDLANAPDTTGLPV